MRFILPQRMLGAHCMLCLAHTRHCSSSTADGIRLAGMCRHVLACAGRLHAHLKSGMHAPVHLVAPVVDDLDRQRALQRVPQHLHSGT
jgi:hypothetical protein